MNPDNNNPFNMTGGNPLGDSGAAMPGLGGLSMNDSLASAQDNLTSAGLAADNPNNVMGLDQIGASAPEAIMAPPITEPLVPAAPVPGSIGSVTSVPPVEPQPAPVLPEVAQPYNPFAPSPTPAPVAGPAADPVLSQPQPAPQAEPVNPFAAPTSPSNPLDNSPVDPSPAAAPAPTNNAAPVQPAPVTMSKTGGLKDAFRNPITLIAAIAAVIFLITTIVFVVLWRQAADNTRIVYVPAVSEGNDNKKPQEVALTCVRAISPENIEISGDTNIVSGENSVLINYYGDDIEGLTAVTTVVYNDAEQAEVARADAENNWPLIQALTEEIQEGITSVSYTTDGNIFRTEFVINPENATWVNNTLGDLGVSTEDSDHSLDNVQASAEAAGFACVTE